MLEYFGGMAKVSAWVGKYRKDFTRSSCILNSEFQSFGQEIKRQCGGGTGRGLGCWIKRMVAVPK